MRRLPLPIFTFVAVVANASLAQTPPVPANGLELLKRVGRHYADAKSYHIKAVEEVNYHNDLQRSWRKTVIAAAERPDGRYHYEGQSAMGSQMQTADGMNVWTYHIDQRLYTKMSVADYTKDAATDGGFTGVAVNAAKMLRRDLAG